MNTKDDDFPYASDDPELNPLYSKSIIAVTREPDEREIKILLRLLIGSAVVLNDEFWRRARLWQSEIDKSRSSTAASSSLAETEGERLRYTLIGLLFQAVDGAADRLKSMQYRSTQARRRVFRLVDPLVSNRLVRPIRHQVEHAASKGESVLQSWIQTGRQEEELSRRLVLEQAYENLLNEVLDYVAQKPEIRDLVQDQGVGMAEEMVGTLRERSTGVDSFLADKANAIFRRRPNNDQPPSQG